MAQKLYESFRWMRDDIKYSGPKGSKAQFKGIALYPTTSGNMRRYVDKELQASARTLVGKPVTVNHDLKRVVGNVTWAEYEDGKIEYVLEIDGKYNEYIQKLRDKFNLPKAEYLNKWKRDPIYGVSVEANYRYHDESCRGRNCTLEPHGIIFNALSLVEDPERPGVEGTTIELLETLGVKEMSLAEAKAFGVLLGDYELFHGLPHQIFESYDREVINTIKEGKIMTKPQKLENPNLILKPKKLKEQDEHTCPEGEHWDEEQGKCVPDVASEQENHQCPEGQHWDETTNTCVPNEAAECNCPPGQHWNGERCVPDGEMLTRSDVEEIIDRKLLPFKHMLEKRDLTEKQAADEVNVKIAEVKKALEKQGFNVASRDQTVSNHMKALEKRQNECCAANKTLNGKIDTETTALREVASALSEKIDTALQSVKAHNDVLEGLNASITGLKETQIPTLETKIAEANKPLIERTTTLETQLTKTNKLLTDKVQNLETQLAETNKASTDKITNVETQLTEISNKLAESEKEYAVLHEAWQKLKTEHTDFVTQKIAEYEEKIDALTKEKEGQLKETQDKEAKRLETLEEKVETLQTHVKPNFKAKEQDPTKKANKDRPVYGSPYA